jgi:hypothetical protein
VPWSVYYAVCGMLRQSLLHFFMLELYACAVAIGAEMYVWLYSILYNHN